VDIAPIVLLEEQMVEVEVRVDISARFQGNLLAVEEVL
jgi:hypothetical protein